MKRNAFYALTFLACGIGLAGCIGLESPSGVRPQWTVKKKAGTESRNGQNGQGGSAVAPDGSPLPAGTTGANGGGGYAQQQSGQSSGGSGFFGLVNTGETPGLPQRPNYDQGSRRAPIRDDNTTWLRQQTAPMEAVPIDKKTGYPIRGSTTEAGTMPVSREGVTGGAPFPDPAAAATPVPQVPMDPADIKTGTRGSAFGRVRSPYPPYLELDSAGGLPGSLARDPATGKVFRIP